MNKDMNDRDKERQAGEPVLEIVAQAPAEADSPPHTIHLLDRDSDTLLFLHEFLGSAGFLVSASSTAEDALDYVARVQPEVLIADLETPDFRGTELVRRVRELAPSTRVILISARADWSLFEELLRSGATDLVAKPLKKITILKAVERALSM